MTLLLSRLSKENTEPRRLTTLWAFTACYRDSFTFIFTLPLEIFITFNIFCDLRYLRAWMHIFAYLERKIMNKSCRYQ
jgi:hypothetical protein